MTAPARTPPSAAALTARPSQFRSPGRSLRPGTSMVGTGPRVDAGGTMWRLRSLVAMSHDATRIAHALGIAPRAARRLINGDTATITPGLRALACQLWDAWWDKRPPEDTPARRRAATTARHLAQRNRWCTPLALDEDCLDQPGYRPYSIWRPATGTGTAPAFRPATPAHPSATRPATTAATPTPGPAPRRRPASRTGAPPGPGGEHALPPHRPPLAATASHASSGGGAA